MGKSEAKRLLQLYESLGEEQAGSLLEFAEFLADRYGKPAQPLAEKQDIERPGEESVVQAIKRLRATYPMLDEAKLLNETSSLFSEHVLGGKAAEEVIDKLEALFLRHYEEFGSQPD